MIFEYGLIIVHPHGTYIYNGNKTIIIKSIHLTNIDNKPLLLIENKCALGIVYLSYPKKINITQFNKLKKNHMITNEERIKWRKQYDTLYQYDIIKFHKFKYTFKIKYPTGPQVLVKAKNIKFILPKINIGTSGFSYDHKSIHEYSQDFNSVEVNSTFYKTPSINTCKEWKTNVDKSFIFSIKVSQYITHYKKLHDIEQEWKKFYHGIKCLHFGCILFQFPLQFSYNEENYNNLFNLTHLLPKNIKFVFEFRNKNWFDNANELIKLFKKNNNWTIALSYEKDTGFIPSYDLIEAINSNFMYIRLHGDNYKHHHSTYVLSKIKEWIYTRYWMNEIFIYFNNTDSYTNKKSDSYNDAKKLQKMLLIH